MSYQAVLTDDGLKIQDDKDNTVWGPAEDYSWPPNQEMAEAAISDANISEPTKSVMQLIVGNVEVVDERNQS